MQLHNTDSIVQCSYEHDVPKTIAQCNVCTIYGLDTTYQIFQFTAPRREGQAKVGGKNIAIQRAVVQTYILYITKLIPVSSFSCESR